MASPAVAQIRTERLTIARGSAAAVVNGVVRGSATIDYLFNVRAGQPLNISVASRNPGLYFNVIEPGQRDVAIHIGQVVGNQFEQVAAKTGDYRIRVYLVRSAARRGEVAPFRLEAIAGRAGRPTQLPGQVPGGSGPGYNASGSVECRVDGAPPSRCEFGVVRQGGGNGLITITRPNGAKRTIFVSRGRPTGYDTSQADNERFSAARMGDDTIVRIGRETYRLPDAIIMGG